MKQCIRIFVIFLIILLLPGCTGYRYDLVEKDDGLYIRLENYTGREIAVGDVGWLYIEFQTFEEMRRDITTGNFTKEEFQKLEVNVVDYKTIGDLPVCDLNTLYALACPENMPTPVIRWCGPHYIQRVDSEIGTVDAYHSSGYSQTSIDREKVYTSPDYFSSSEADGFVVNDIQTETDRNATAYYWTNWQGENKSLFYELEKDGITYFVRENYPLHDDDYIEGIPSEIRIYSEDGSHAAFISVTNLVERPSVEWLSSFYFYEYVAE